MSVWLLIAITVVTVGSRVAALAVLPAPPAAVAGLVERLPAPLFAALAALSIAGSEAGLAHPPLAVAVACALVSVRWSSLLVTLAAGLGGYLTASWVF